VTAVPAEVDRLGGRRVLLVAGTAAKAHADDLAERLADRVADRIDGVAAHVPAALAAEAAARARESAADLVVSLGGGSATGLAKAVALETSLPVLAVPTTYAGSEMTPIWGLTEGAPISRSTWRTTPPPLAARASLGYQPRLPASAAGGLRDAHRCLGLDEFDLVHDQPHPVADRLVGQVE
jgi:maleylacetate reductase